MPYYLRRFFLRRILSEESVKEVIQIRQKLKDERSLTDSKIKTVCFLSFSLIFISLFCILFYYKRQAWLTNSYGTLEVLWTFVLGILGGLLTRLVIGVGLIANLLISYAHLIEAKLKNLSEVFEHADEVLSKDEWEAMWKEYELHIELYKYYLDLGLKANLFFYFITGGILGIYLNNPASRLMKFSLLLPILISLAFGGVFIHGAFLWMRVSVVIREIRRELKLKKAPDINILSVLLLVFGTIFLVIGISIILLAVFT